MVFDTHASIPDRSVLENVRLPLDLRGIDQVEGDVRALALLEELGIADAASKRPGEAQRRHVDSAAVGAFAHSRPALSRV